MRFLKALFHRSIPTEPVERRASPRTRTRLRPGKLLHETGAFLTDCALVDRSPRGMRVRSYGPCGEVGDSLVVFDEKDEVLREGRIVWLRGTETGIRIEGETVRPDPRTVQRIAGPYYATGE